MQPRPAVLVADGLDFYRTYLERVLTDGGFDVVTAGSCTAVRARLEEWEGRLDVALIDHALPGGGAAEILPPLRSQWSADVLPVLVLISTGPSVGSLELASLGVDGTLIKMAAPEHLAFRIRQLVAIPGSERRLSPRVTVDSPVCFDGDRLEGFGRLTDVSVGGLQIHTVGRLPQAGSLLQVSFVLPGDETVLTAAVRVLRTGRLRMAVTFDTLDQAARLAIQSHLARSLAESPSRRHV